MVKTAGTVTVWGTDIDQNPRQARANIGIVPQELNVDAFFTPRQTIDLMAGLFGVPKAERQTDAILDLVGPLLLPVLQLQRVETVLPQVSIQVQSLGQGRGRGGVK